MIPRPKPFQIFILVAIAIIFVLALAYMSGVRLPKYVPSPPKVYSCPNGDWNGTKANMTHKTETSLLPRVYTWFNPSTDQSEVRMGWWLKTEYFYKCPVCDAVVDEYETMVAIG